MSDDLTCNPLPISIVEGWARVCLENMAGYEPEAWRTVRRVPRVDVEAAFWAAVAAKAGRAHVLPFAPRED